MDGPGDRLQGTAGRDDGLPRRGKRPRPRATTAGAISRAFSLHLDRMLACLLHMSEGSDKAIDQRLEDIGLMRPIPDYITIRWQQLIIGLVGILVAVAAGQRADGRLPRRSSAATPMSKVAKRSAPMPS